MTSRVLEHVHLGSTPGELGAARRYRRIHSWEAIILHPRNHMDAWRYPEPSESQSATNGQCVYGSFE